MKGNKYLKQILATVMVFSLMFSTPMVIVDANEMQPVGKNVALGKPIVSNVNSLTEAEAEEITDGNTTTGGQATKLIPDESAPLSDPQEWTIDLGMAYRIDKIVLAWEAACASAYDIYVSENGETWKSVSSVTDGKSGERVINFEESKAKYVKLDLKTRALNYGYHLYEWEVYTVGSTEDAITTNLALSAVAESDIDDGNNPASNAIDGNADTYWRTDVDTGADHNLTLTWAQKQKFNAIKISWDNGYMMGYKFQTSEDGETWTDIHIVRDGKAGESRKIKFNEIVETKYLRLQGVTMGAYCFEVYEIEVYDESNIPAETLYLGANEVKLNLDVANFRTQQIQYAIGPSNAADKSVTWTSADTAIATVDENGVVTGQKVGQTTVTAVSNSNPNLKQTCTVYVTSGIGDTIVTAERVNKTNSALVEWDAVDGSIGYELYRIEHNKETLVYEGTGTSYTDKDLAVGTIKYYVKILAPVNSVLYTDSISQNSNSIMIPIDVTGIYLNKDTLDINVGNTSLLEATVTPTDATNPEFTWTSSDETIATVDKNGLVTAVGEGTVTITVTTEDGGYEDTCTVNCIEVTATKIALTSSYKNNMELNETLNITAKVYPINTTYPELKWESTDENVITVNQEGVVTAVGIGTATIKVTNVATPEVYAEMEIKVATSVTAIDLNTKTIEIYEGDSYQLTPVFTPLYATNQKVAWTSSYTAVADVNGNGLVTGLTPGKATITVISDDGSYTATCEVVVKEKIVPTTQAPTTLAAPAKGKVKKAQKDLASKKMKINLKSVGTVSGYEVYVYKTKKNAKKNKKAIITKDIKKLSFNLKSSKLKNKKQLFVRVRAYILDDNGNKVYGEYSAVKKAKIKK